MSNTSHQARSVGYDAGSTTVEGINSFGERYALEIWGPRAREWYDVLRGNARKRCGRAKASTSRLE